MFTDYLKTIKQLFSIQKHKPNTFKTFLSATRQYEISSTLGEWQTENTTDTPRTQTKNRKNHSTPRKTVPKRQNRPKLY
jgi:hypothetical protein